MIKSTLMTALGIAILVVVGKLVLMGARKIPGVGQVVDKIPGV